MRPSSRWKKLPGDEGAAFDKSMVWKGSEIAPQITWGTNPGQVISIDKPVPSPADFSDPVDRNRQNQR